MAQSRLHGVATIFTRLEGMIGSGAIAKNDTPIWFDVYARFPPRRPPDAERPLIQKPLKPILYPEDNLRAQFFKNYSNSNMTGDKGLMTSDRFKGGVADVFLKSFETFKRMRPEYNDDDVWYLALRWMQDGMGIALTHRGDQTTVATVKDVERKMAEIETLDEKEMNTFLEKIEREELVEDEVEEGSR